ncbi:hypothetical protein D6856_03255 [Butyrivibrio sp. XB500-5]|uniref:hypothetical protein n=1 Tax=Butyrivibrio sp. XB500-5 TaxID=2364880 RepID=UPI000EA8FBFF|nr:hypothetical protein [Butyrivibrio sp. XB500-5]RKM63155.1 hypothetical protein D6856_03255 [Butyrivibrio sp. XB500-5]
MNMIKLDVQVFTSIVAGIKTQSDNIIATETGYVNPDPEILRNSIIPDYQQADHGVNDMLRLMKQELTHVTQVMDAIRVDYETVDREKTADCEQVYNSNAS